MFDSSVLKEMKLSELQEIAKLAKTIKFNGVKKDVLIDMILAQQAATSDENPKGKKEAAVKVSLLLHFYAHIFFFLTAANIFQKVLHFYPIFIDLKQQIYISMQFWPFLQLHHYNVLRYLLVSCRALCHYSD